MFHFEQFAPFRREVQACGADEARGGSCGVLERLTAALRPYGWRPSDEPPVITLPWPGSFVRPLDSGWAAVLTVTRYTRDEIDLASWRRGMREVLDIESAVIHPGAEVLAAQLGRWPALDLDVAPPFGGPGEAEALRQLSGSPDHERAVAEIVAYARDVVVPAAGDAGLDRWMAVYAELGRDDPRLLAWEVPLMLLAHGRGDEAIERVGTALRDPQLATAELAAFADRIAQLVRSGQPLPSDGAVLAERAAEHARRVRPNAAGGS